MKAEGTGSRPEEAGPLPPTALAFQELLDLVTSLGGEPFRARQIAGSLLAGKARNWREIPGLPGALREKLEARGPLFSSHLDQVVSSPDGTKKMVFRLAGGVEVEAALIPSGKRRTLCLSSQAGCPVGCRFCASGIGGLARNLEAHEILEQALLASTLLPVGERITHLVVMGVGEPLLNLESLLPALETLESPESLGIGARRMVVSTAGVVPGMRVLAERRPFLNLAVSLHTADQALREELVPLARRWRVEEILDEARRYRQRTGRRVTLEVVLLEGVTDTPGQARLLARAVEGKDFHVNLIAWNQVPGLPFHAPAPGRVRAFASLLLERGVNVTIRSSRGKKAAAACGQLRRRGGEGEGEKHQKAGPGGSRGERKERRG